MACCVQNAPSCDPFIIAHPVNYSYLPPCCRELLKLGTPYLAVVTAVSTTLFYETYVAGQEESGCVVVVITSLLLWPQQVYVYKLL